MKALYNSINEKLFDDSSPENQINNTYEKKIINNSINWICKNIFGVPPAIFKNGIEKNCKIEDNKVIFNTDCINFEDYARYFIINEIPPEYLILRGNKPIVLEFNIKMDKMISKLISNFISNTPVDIIRFNKGGNINNLKLSNINSLQYYNKEKNSNKIINIL